MSMSLEAIFAKVEKHLITQNAKSVNKDGDCEYRNHLGQSCAIGCLIPANRYFKELEGAELPGDEPLQDALKHVIGVNPKKRHMKIDLLMELMSVHDDSHVADWKHELTMVKDTWGIKGPKND
jgi:hypothetical protein